MKKKNHYKPTCLMSIHGYLSTGKWQTMLDEVLDDTDIIHKPYKYGLKIFRVLPYQINNDTIKFRDWYFKRVSEMHFRTEEPFHRPSIIAHSLGSWILAKALLTYPELKFDKIFLHGSIVPSDFDWFKLILNGQINSIICETCKNDKIVPLGIIFTSSVKGCGKYGIYQKSSFIREENISEYGHSTFQYKEHFKQYVIRRLYETPHQLSVINGAETTEIDIVKIFKQSNEIDKSAYSDAYNDSPISIETAMNWYRIEKDIWSFVKNIYTKEILAYINAIPVNDETYQKFMSGKLNEIDLKSNEILVLDTSSNYNLIVLSIAIKKGLNYEENTLHRGRIAEILIMTAITKINSYLSKRKKLKKIGAVAWTAEGEKLCKGFCMTKKEDVKSDFPYYEIDLKKFDKKLLSEANFMSKWWFNKKLKI